jgi:uncharacterized protein YfaT (DUF1175 family)
MRRSLIAAAGLALWLAAAPAQVRFLDDTDRNACRSWLVLLADAQFYRPTPDVTDCAGLLRHALREALRAHTAEWLRRWSIPGMPILADVRRTPLARHGAWPIFRIGGDRYAEFADARTIVRYNTSQVGRDIRAARPGDLLYFHQDSGDAPDHLMVFIGPSAFDASARDWIVYHTGPDGARAGEVRKVRAADLARHPSARWRPVPGNPVFVGVFRLAFL